MSDQVGPATARERLRARLRQLREAKRLPAARVAKQMDWSLSKLNRIETGAVTIQPVEVQVLAQLYGVRDEAEIARLRQLSVISRERMWWSELGLAEGEFKKFLAYEHDASHFYGYQALFVPGLLQTPEYARELISKINTKDPDDPAVEERVQVRLKRQESLIGRLDGPEPPALTFAIDEAALRRPIGGDAVMAAQLDHLLGMAARPTIEVAVIPLRTGGHPGLGGTFELLEFAGEDDIDVLFVESAASDVFIRDAEVAQDFHEFMNVLLADGLTGDEALREIRDIRATMTH